MSLLKNSSIYTIGNLLPAVVGFMLLPVYTHYLSPEEYGVLASMEVLAYLYTVFVNFNLERASYRFYFDSNDKQWRKDLLFTIHYASIILGIVLLLVILSLQDIVTLAFPSIPFWPIYILVLGRITIEVVLTVPQQYFQLIEKPLIFVGISLSKFFVNIFFVLWFLIIREDGVTGVFVANIIASTMMIPIGIIIAKMYFNGKFRKEILIDSLIFAWPFIPTLIIAWVVNLSDRVFLEYYTTQMQLGIYGMAYKLSSAYLLLMKAYHTAYLPRYYKYANLKDQNVAVDTLAKDAKMNVVIHIIICFMMILWAPELIYYLLPYEYNEVTLIMRILLVSHLFSAIASVTFSPAMLQAKKTKNSMYAAIIASLINIALNFLLIPEYGMYGAAIATVFSILSLFIIQYFMSILGYQVAFPWRIFLVSLFFGFFIVSLFEFLIEGNLINTLILKTVVTLILMRIAYNMIINVTHTNKDLA